ncbi:MAG: pantoate--beta-alanine ligase [Planctomycetota bacterium]|nr:MAG: pantoate--beta-alanine ligase [Planctomycetota bacterium]
MILRLRTREELARWRARLAPGAALGFVPTMGALHAGHQSLVVAARRECDAVLASVFVNPLQFDQRDDFERYPRTEDADCELLHASGADAVYLPAAADVYRPGAAARVLPGPAGADFEGRLRPGHFAGVLTVVLKLLQRARPHRAYFGEKDAQQLFLVRELVADLDVPVAIRPCPTVREADGLALSSRNARLDAAARAQAPVLFRALRAAVALYAAGERRPPALEHGMRTVYAAAGIIPDYAAVVDDATFLAPQDGAGADAGAWRAITAARIGGTRLLDNLALAAC